MMATPNEDISEQLAKRTEDLSITDDDGLKVCANCGKEGTHLNKCNKCKAATYCNASCKKKHRSKHKKECDRRLAELHEEELERERREVELHDEKLFKRPPPKGDCPICMLLLPSLFTGLMYRSCCGKIICSGCIHAVKIRDGGVNLCPFCRAPAPDSDEMIEQINKRVEICDAEAIHNLGGCYSRGMHGLPQDRAKALELYHQAAKHGNVNSCYSIGYAYYNGNGVEMDEKKANHYWELAAMGGHVQARHNLGMYEGHAGNMGRAVKHFMIATEFGYYDSLENIKRMFMNGDATKDDYAKALLSYQANLVEIKSAQRDEAAAINHAHRYY
jgi:hypothetical protein